MNCSQIFRENLKCYALSIFRVFILLASSDSDKHMLMRQKKCKQRFAYSQRERIIVNQYLFSYLCSASESPAVPLYPPIEIRYLSVALATLKMEYSANVTFPSKSSRSTLSVMLSAAAM